MPKIIRSSTHNQQNFDLLLDNHEFCMSFKKPKHIHISYQKAGLSSNDGEKTERLPKAVSKKKTTKP
jgi:hypothetical protein